MAADVSSGGLWRGKSADRSARSRQAGNEAFADGEWNKALAMYTASAVLAPVDLREDALKEMRREGKGKKKQRKSRDFAAMK